MQSGTASVFGGAVDPVTETFVYLDAIDGQPVPNMASFVKMLDAHEFGDRVTLTVRRSDERVEVPVTLSGAGQNRVR